YGNQKMIKQYPTRHFREVAESRPVAGRRLRPLRGISDGKGFLQMAMTLDCPVGAATCRPCHVIPAIPREVAESSL
ncbi:MAG: hypothetical protein LBQ75_07005, partial [Zoogloeaceae bacterium]|nr:hypothetical protein [Zoogloeaceae bacterium]